MNKRYLAFLAVICLTIFSVPTRPQTTGTILSLTAHWDDNSDVAGSVTIASVHVVGADTVLAKKELDEGSASMRLPLESNSLYHVTVSSASGSQLVKFPITTALVNPKTIERGTMNLVLHKSDNSLKTANIQVSMEF